METLFQKDSLICLISFPSDIKSIKSHRHPIALSGWVHRSGKLTRIVSDSDELVELELADIAQGVLQPTQPPAQLPVQPPVLPFIEVDRSCHTETRAAGAVCPAGYVRSGDDHPSRHSTGNARSYDARNRRPSRRCTCRKRPSRRRPCRARPIRRLPSSRLNDGMGIPSFCFLVPSLANPICHIDLPGIIIDFILRPI